MWLREQLLGCLSKLLDLQLNGCPFFGVTNTGGREEGGRVVRGRVVRGRVGGGEQGRGVDLLLTCHA